jgi:hypothetical protein
VKTVKEAVQMINAMEDYSTAEEIREQVGRASKYGATPVTSLTLLGHGSSQHDDIAFRFGKNAVSARDVFKTSADMQPRSGFWDAATHKFASPLCWFSTTASVRITGCSTSLAAKGWAKYLRAPATAYGTTRTLHINDNHETWFVSNQRYRNPAQLHASRFWKGETGKN